MDPRDIDISDLSSFLAAEGEEDDTSSGRLSELNPREGAAEIPLSAIARGEESKEGVVGTAGIPLSAIARGEESKEGKGGREEEFRKVSIGDQSPSTHGPSQVSEVHV